MKIRNLSLTVIVGSILFAGCASKPEEIQTAYISPNKYNTYTCEQVTSELEYVSNETSNLYTIIKKKADNDAIQMGVGLVLFWPTLFFLEGGDGPEAVQYANLKGEYKALRKAIRKKSCSIDNLPPSPEEIIQAKRLEEKIRL